MRLRNLPPAATFGTEVLPENWRAVSRPRVGSGTAQGPHGGSERRFTPPLREGRATTSRFRARPDSIGEAKAAGVRRQLDGVREMPALEPHDPLPVEILQQPTRGFCELAGIRDVRSRPPRTI